jgi:hypothetical protein
MRLIWKTSVQIDASQLGKSHFELEENAVYKYLGFILGLAHCA